MTYGRTRNRQNVWDQLQLEVKLKLLSQQLWSKEANIAQWSSWLSRACSPTFEDYDCLRCGSPVYAAELRSTKTGIYHTLCFRCHSCQRLLNMNNFTELDDKTFCNICYKMRWKTANTSLLTDECRIEKVSSHPMGSGKTTSILAESGAPDQCPKCLGKVFQAEKILSANAAYHKACFRCAEVECGKSLDSTSYCDSPQGECPWWNHRNF